jgi:hypothetical protein
VKRRVGLARLGGRDERSRIKLAIVAKTALEPDRELARHAELMECFAMVACALVHGRIAHAAQVVEKGPLRRPDDLLFP